MTGQVITDSAVSPGADPGASAAPEGITATLVDPRVRAAVDRAHDVATVDVTETPAIFDDVYRRLQAALARPEAP